MPETITKGTLLGEVLHQWTVLEYEQHERNKAWYFLMTLFGVFLVAYALFSGNFLFALIIILFAIILFLQSHQAPQQLLFQITEMGITIGSRFYPYSELENFYLIYNPPEVKTLFLHPKGLFQPLLRVPLLDINPIEVKNVLREYLPEDLEKEKEPMSDKVARDWKIH